MSDCASSFRDYRQSWDYAQVGLDFGRELGIGWAISWALSNMAYAAWHLGAYAEARHYAHESLSYVIKAGWDYPGMWTVINAHLIATILIGEGRKERAYELLGFIDQQCQRLNIPKHDKELALLHLLDEELSPSLAAAVKRGRERNLDLVVKEILAELSSVSSTPILSSSRPQVQPHSQRELEILHLLADGLNSREIAQRLYLSVTTIRWYQRQLYSKLDAHTRSEAIARARELKILT